MSDEKAEAIWAVVELMGHVRLAGRVSEEEKFGGKLGRLDIPMPDGTFVTQYFGAGSVYRITLVTEQVARDVAKRSTHEPVSAWDYPNQLAVRQDYADPDPDPYRDDEEDRP